VDEQVNSQNEELDVDGKREEKRKAADTQAGGRAWMWIRG
jgi:hypothetical protein